jgi:hypothetical protein
MPTFNNLDSLFNFVKKNTKAVLPQLTQQIEETIKKYIMERQYKWQPDDYFRTYDYINSLTVSKIEERGEVYHVELYFDTDKIIPNTVKGNWNQHEDFWGNPTNEDIPLWLEEGTPGNPYFQHPGNHAILDTYNEYKDSKAVKELILLLKSKGFNCIII